MSEQKLADRETPKLSKTDRPGKLYRSDDVEEKRPSWQTGEANNVRKEANKKAKMQHKKAVSSKKPDNSVEEQKQASDDAAKDAEDAKEKVVHPWHLMFVKHRWVDSQSVIIDSKDVQGVYQVAVHADNIQGSGLLRTLEGTGTILLPRVWGNVEYVRKACDPLAGEALGKLDLDVKYLVPRAIVNLTKWVTPWPGVEKEIAEYLGSAPFAQLVVDHYQGRLGRVYPLLQAKCLRYAATINADTREVNVALMLYQNPKKWGLLWTFWSLGFVFALMGVMFGFLEKRRVLAFVWGVIAIICGFALYVLEINFKAIRIYLQLYSEKFAVSYGSLIEIMSTCSKGISLPAFLKCWKFSLSPGVQELACKTKKAYDSFGTWISGANMVIPNGCHHDQYNGLAIRYFFDRTVDSEAARSCIEAGKEFFKKYTMLGEWKLYSHDEWISHLRSKRQVALNETPEAINVQDHVNVDIFVKMEAYLGKNPDAFKPRIIQGRMLAYFNIVGAFFYSISKWLGACFCEKNGSFIYDSGLDALDLGRIATRMFTEYRFVYEIDVSNWDGSLIPLWLVFEIWFIENIAPCLPPRWMELKRHWTTVKGTGKNGVKYSTKHGRRSGDMWTSAFNSLINLVILFWIFGWDILAVAKGDDNFFGTNKKLTVEQIVNKYASIGMKAKVKSVNHISQLGYCSGTFYETDKGWKWGVCPFRIIAKLGLNLKRHPIKSHKRLLYGTAVSMLPIGNHVPVLGPLLRAIVDSGKSRNLSPLFPENEEWKTSSDTLDEVTPTGLHWFCQNYGFTLEDVDNMEFMTTFNVNEGRPLNLDDFPLVFEDPLFLRGYQKDVGLDVIPECDNITITRRTAGTTIVDWMHVWMVLLLSPVLEEFARNAFPLLVSIGLGISEFLLTGRIFQLVFHLAMYLINCKWGLFPSLIAHGSWNTYIMLSQDRWVQGGRRGVGYGSLLHCWQSVKETLPRRRPDVFTFMPNCVGLNKHRLIGIARRFSNQWYNRRGVKERTKKTKSSQSRPGQKKGPSAKASTKNQLGRNLLKGGLGALGSMFGPAGTGIGSSLGDWGANILGMGDYEVKNNSIIEGNGVPTMHLTKRGVVVSHREFLGDITGSTGFVSRDYVINPGSSKTFPWLSNIAAMFQSYRIKGMVVDFNSTSADALNSVNTALGTVIMSTQYNVALPKFLNKAEMEQYEYTVSGRPSRNLLHCIECDPSLQVMSHLFTRTGDLPAGQDYQFYDWGRFQLATVGMQSAATIGELWVSYEIEFLKPRIASGGAWPGDFTRISNGPFTAAADPLGSIQTSPIGNLGVTVTAGGTGWQRIFFPNNISAGRFQVTVLWRGTAAAFTAPSRTLSNLTAQAVFGLGLSSDVTVPSTGASTTAAVYTSVVTVNGYSDAGSYIELGLAGTLPAGAISVDILVVALPLSDAAF